MSLVVCRYHFEDLKLVRRNEADLFELFGSELCSKTNGLRLETSKSL